MLYLFTVHHNCLRIIRNFKKTKIKNTCYL